MNNHKVNFTLYTVFFIFFLSVLNSAQTLKPFDLFPYNVSNKWEYETIYGIATVEFYKDSVDEEGFHYLFRKYNDYKNPDPTYKIDTTNQDVYNLSLDSWLYYKLNADSGDSWIVDTFIDNQDTTYKLASVRSKTQANIFGKLRYKVEITFYDYQHDKTINDSSFARTTITLVEGLGEYLEFDEDGYGAQRTLKGCVINGKGYGTLTSVKNNKFPVNSFELKQNYPNPFNPTTQIEFSLKKSGLVKLKIYNALGKEVATLKDNIESAGIHKVSFNAENFSSGIYFYTLFANGINQTKKMILIK